MEIEINTENTDQSIHNFMQDWVKTVLNNSGDRRIQSKINKSRRHNKRMYTTNLDKLSRLINKDYQRKNGKGIGKKIVPISFS